MEDEKNASDVVRFIGVRVLLNRFLLLLTLNDDGASVSSVVIVPNYYRRDDIGREHKRPKGFGTRWDLIPANLNNHLDRI